MVNDARLTADALRVVLHYATKHGAGPHPYAPDELRELLNEAGPKRIARALKRAERHGYLTRHHGGRGHTDAFTATLTPAASADVNENTPAASDDLS